MQDINVLKDDRVGEEAFEKFDIASYTKTVFSMFGGEEVSVKLSVDNSLIGVIVDRFGKNIFIEKESDNTFVINVKIALSPQFFGWLFGLGTKVKILAPQKAVDEFSSYAKSISDLYN